MRTLLTTRQREVLTLIAQGKEAKEIGQLLGLSRKTVERHRELAYKAAGMHSILDVVHWAIHNGIIPIKPFPSGLEAAPVVPPGRDHPLRASVDIKSDREALAQFLPEAWKR